MTRHWLRLATAGALLSCGVSRPWELVPEPATDLPEQFVPDADQPTAMPVAGCRGRLRDPRDGTVLVLERSTAVVEVPARYQGDYSVPPGNRYGIGSDQLLRVECLTGRGLGVVPRE